MTQVCERRGEKAPEQVHADPAFELDALPSLAALFGQDLTLRACTDAYAAWLGSTPDELIGRRLPDIVPPEFADRAHADGTRSAAGFLQHVQIVSVEPDGRRRVRRVTLVPYVVNDEQIGVAVLADLG